MVRWPKATRQKYLVGLAFLTWRGLAEYCGSDGFGRSGYVQRGPQQGLLHLAIQWTKRFFKHQRWAWEIKALFWHSSWLDGKAPIDLAPNLYTLAWRKNQMVKDDLLSHSWTRGLSRTETVQ
jgi:hypothetical protein